MEKKERERKKLKETDRTEGADLLKKKKDSSINIPDIICRLNLGCFYRSKLTTAHAFSIIHSATAGPSPTSPDIELPLWTFRQIKKTWKLGSVSTSKSQLLNSLINPKHDTFFHRDSPGSSRTRLFMEGLMEIAWYCPNTDELFSECIAFCNLHGKKVHGNMWNDIDDEYLDAYIGVLLLAGVYKSSNEATDSLWDASTGRNIFRATMSLQNFQMISRVLRFDNRDTRAKSDKLAPIRDVWEKWVQLLPLMFNPGPEVTVDERFLPFRGKCPFRKYMPSKPGKNGIKIWAACDAKTSYAWNLQIYTGKSASSIPEKKQGKRVVLDMTTGLQGHNITCDNFFTSYDLVQELTMVGTVKKNKPELPAAMLQVKDRAPLSSKFVFTDTTTAVSYCPKNQRNVILMSTLHKDAAVSSGSDKKPIIILDYNKNKGGVDNLDKLTATYTCQRMTRRWPMVVFYNILDVSAYNAFVLWTHIHQGWNSNKKNKRRMFLEELGRSLVKSSLEKGQSGDVCKMLIRVKEEVKEELKFDYLLVVDTGGLRSLEQVGRSTHSHDNELVTFVTGLANMTLINILGENPAEMEGVLHVIIQAILRMKEVKLDPGCMFVHQNIADITTAEKNKDCICRRSWIK
ncbi:hypothetical protein NFI96_022436 [Prochilodus magdalenae]|nr:hypothetical protein NFI96_022436 [Prochilodus magdalenae]